MADIEALLREILAAQAVFDTKLEATNRDVSKAAENASKALEVSTRIATVLEEQDINTRFTEHRAEVRQVISELRQDVVHATTQARTAAHGEDERLRTDLAALAKRVEALESDLQQRKGAGAVGAWLSKNMPWLLVIVAAVATVFGIEGMKK